MAYKSPGNVSEKEKHPSKCTFPSQLVYSYQSDNNSHICHYLISKRLKETMQLNFRVKTDADLPLSYCVYCTR